LKQVVLVVSYCNPFILNQCAPSGRQSSWL
jgi:hypothetical protein